MKTLVTIFGLLLLCIVVFGQKNSAIFLHHSVGGDVYNRGKVATEISTYNSQHATNYQVTDKNFPDTPWPWENYPYDYWKLWIDGSCDNLDPDIPCLDKLTSTYELIIFKHCYPGAEIIAADGNPQVSSKVKTLENYKLQYRALRAKMDQYPNNKFLVWTLTPEHRLATDAGEAARAKEFVDWVKNVWLTENGSHPNIYLFDFFSLIAELSPTPAQGQQYCLKYEYEYSHTDLDSHPNLAADLYVGPLFAQRIVEVFQNPTTVSDLPHNANAQVVFTYDRANHLIGYVNHTTIENLKIEMYDLLGRKLGEQLLKNDENSFVAPNFEGVLVIKYLLNGNNMIYKVIL